MLILSAVGSLALGAALAASLPQLPDTEAIDRFRAGWPLLAPCFGALGLLGSPLFHLGLLIAVAFAPAWLLRSRDAVPHAQQAPAGRS